MDTEGRTVALCRVKTPSKFAGVPGVTNQSAAISNGDLAWCVHCCGKALEILNETIPKSKIPEGLMMGYYLPAMELLVMQIMLANGINVQ